MSFHYLSFQRSPPRQLQYEEELNISPLLTNDLREATFQPERPGDLCIAVAWVAVNAADGYADQDSEWTVVKRQDDINWTGEETAWKKVRITAPSWKEVQAATTRQHQSKGNVRSRQVEVRLAMWVQGQLSSRQTTTTSGAGDGTRLAKKTRTKRFSNLTSTDLLARLSIDPYHVALVVLRLRQDAFLPVLTPPITLSPAERSSPSTSRQAPKFSEIARFWYVPAIQAEKSGSRRQQHYIEIREELGYQLDKHVWDASLALMGSLCLAHSAHLRDSARRRSSSRQGQRPQDLMASQRGCVTVELGTGTGLLSLWLQRRWPFPPNDAKVGKVSADDFTSSATRRMFLTDLEDSLALAKSNAQLNRLAEEASRSDSGVSMTMPDVDILGLDWFSSSPPHEVVGALCDPSGSQKRQCCEGGSGQLQYTRPHLLVMASDCSYNPDTYPAFARTIKRLLLAAAERPSGTLAIESNEANIDGQQAMCLLAKKHRNSDEQSLWDVLKREGLQIQLDQGWHNDYVKHADIADVDQDVGGDALHKSENDALGKWGIYVILLAPDVGHREG